ncbi:MAG: hypothetical protein ACLFTE_11250 [Salinivenus sp.]
MIIDAHTLPQGHVHETEICILGGGVAGLTLARELAGSNVDVCVLEHGGIEEEEEAQRFHRGEVGRAPDAYPYWSLDYARQAQLGGCSNRWYVKLNDGTPGARFRPLDAIDFERRDGIPHSGWPFSKSDYAFAGVPKSRYANSLRAFQTAFGGISTSTCLRTSNPIRLQQLKRYMSRLVSIHHSPPTLANGTTGRIAQEADYCSASCDGITRKSPLRRRPFLPDGCPNFWTSWAANLG